MNNRLRRMAAITRRRRRVGTYAVHREGGQDTLHGNTEETLQRVLNSAFDERTPELLDRLDERKLGYAAVNAVDAATRSAAVKRISDTDILKTIVCLAKDRDIIHQAMDKAEAIERDPLRGLDRAEVIGKGRPGG